MGDALKWETSRGIVSRIDAPFTQATGRRIKATFDTVGATPFGVFRSVERPVYDEGVAEQIRVARERSGDGDLEALLHAGDTWQIG